MEDLRLDIKLMEVEIEQITYAEKNQRVVGKATNIPECAMFVYAEEDMSEELPDWLNALQTVKPRPPMFPTW